MLDVLGATLTETHHALLFAWISRAIVGRVGPERGERAVRKAVRRYGEQRGRRMALRARADGQELSMTNFLVYSEWRASNPARSESEKYGVGSDYHTNIIRCPWNSTWSEADLLPYGRLYCLEIDHALVRGFNPELRLDVNRTLTNDGGACEFVYHQVDLQEAERRTANLGERAVMPWAYHCGHLYKTLRESLVEEFDEEGQAAVDEAMAEFTARFGDQATKIVRSYQDTDFDSLPARTIPGQMDQRAS